MFQYFLNGVIYLFIYYTPKTQTVFVKCDTDLSVQTKINHIMFLCRQAFGLGENIVYGES